MACIVGTEPDAVGKRYSSSNISALLCRKATTCGCRVCVVDVHHKISSAPPCTIGEDTKQYTVRYSTYRP